MEVPRMEEAEKDETHMTSAAAFVEGGIQPACDDACSICLEDFCESDPSTETSCRHEFHLQCILEWCQRSSQCPMCMQTIIMKDATSQELLEAVERERKIRMIPRNATIFHHPTLGDFELQHLPVGAADSELEERIMQHLAAAAAMGRAHHMGRREVQRSRTSAHTRPPHFLVFSSHPNGQPSGPSPPTQGGGEAEPAAVASPSTPLTSGELSPHVPQLFSTPTGQSSSSASGSNVINQPGFSSRNRSASLPSSQNQDRAGPSELQSFSDSLKSRFNAASTRYKESISKSTRGWKERLFSRSSSMADLGSEVRREVNAGIASVSRMMERLETKENSRDDNVSVSNHTTANHSNQHNTQVHSEYPLRDSKAPTSFAASSGSN